MIDLADTIKPKSDQLNSDDLIAGPVTVKIRDVTSRSGDQPIAINFDGDNGKPFLPCKSMRRVLVQAWGRDGAKYIGRSMTLYRDPKVKWAGQEVGGIRISHLSDIDADITMVLTETKASRKPFTVKKLTVTSGADVNLLKMQAEQECHKGIDALGTWFKALSKSDAAAIKPFLEEYKTKAAEVKPQNDEDILG